MQRTRTQGHLVSIAIAIVCGCWSASASSAHAQTCDEDASNACVDDAGSEEDAGSITTMPPPTHDGGSGGMSSTSTDACSCTTNRNYDDLGTVHVCTGSIDMKACDTLSCSHGNHRAYACSSDDVRLCCELPHQLYSQLYDDCDHPRCELGFRAECESEGGRIHSGACDIPDNVKKGSGGGGICSVARASGSEPGPCAFLLLAVAAASRLCRRAR